MHTSQVTELFVPGRVCLFGEHSDWAGGYRTTNPEILSGKTIICGTNTGIYARASAHDDALVLRSTVDGEVVSAEIPMDHHQLLKTAEAGGHWSYVAGVALQMQKRFGVRGLVLENYLTDLPVQKGLSSSAAVSVLTARAFNWVYDLGLTIQDEMEYAYLGEITTPSRCGRMDQGCAFGQTPIQMTFDGDTLQVEPIRVGGEIHLVIVDLCAYKDTHRILADLHACFPDNPSVEAQDVRQLLGPINHSIISKANHVLNNGDAKGLGELMTASQLVFDCYARPACPSQLQSPVLHELLADKRVKALSFGGKGVGSQGDGSAQLVARSEADQLALINLINDELGLYAMPMTITPSLTAAPQLSDKLAHA